MNFKSFLAFTFAVALAFTASFALPATVNADCSPTGYYNSNRACAKSIKANNNYQYQYQYQDRYQNTGFYLQDAALLSMIERLREMIRLLEDRLEDRDFNRDSDVSVATRSAINIDENEATLRGRIDLNREDEAEVYFEYGESRTRFTEETDPQTIKDDDDSFNFSEDIDDLDENTVYYFRAVAEDEDGDEDYGVTLSFRTDRDSSNDDEPELNTRDAQDIEDNSAELHGIVDMNDFDNGEVFFVYGEDEDQIEDIADDYDEYDEIDEDGDNLQKVMVDNDLDTRASYQEDVSGLEEDTDIYFSICVEYEDEDDDPMIACGDVESFKTDES